jgi:uncharacterized protein DUF6893
MKDIKVSPTAQLVALAAIGLAIAGVIAANLAEVQRYLKVRRM